MNQSRQVNVSLYMVQVLYVLGCVQLYLWKRRRAADSHCFHCEESEDSVEHNMLFHYPFYAEGRREMEQCIGRRLTPDDVSHIILGPEQELLPDYMSRIQRIKTSAEKQKLAFSRLLPRRYSRKGSFRTR